MPSVNVTSTVHLTPEVLATAFWQMDTQGQVAFFEALATEVRTTYADPNNLWRGQCGPEGEGQWWALGQDLAGNDKARSMLMTIAAPLFMHTLCATEGQPDAFVLHRLQRQRDSLAVWLQALLDETAVPPEANCSCFISPPCEDCLSHSRVREVINSAQGALTEVWKGGGR